MSEGGRFRDRTAPDRDRKASEEVAHESMRSRPVRRSAHRSVFRHVPFQLQRVDDPHGYAGIVLDGLIGREAQVGQTACQLLQSDLHLHSREGRAQAEMTLRAESKMAIADAARGTEGLRVLKFA